MKRFLIVLMSVVLLSAGSYSISGQTANASTNNPDPSVTPPPGGGGLTWRLVDTTKGNSIAQEWTSEISQFLLAYSPSLVSPIAGALSGFIFAHYDEWPDAEYWTAKTYVDEDQYAYYTKTEVFFYADPARTEFLHMYITYDHVMY